MLDDCNVSKMFYKDMSVGRTICWYDQHISKTLTNDVLMRDHELQQVIMSYSPGYSSTPPTLHKALFMTLNSKLSEKLPLLSWKSFSLLFYIIPGLDFFSLFLIYRLWLDQNCLYSSVTIMDHGKNLKYRPARAALISAEDRRPVFCWNY